MDKNKPAEITRSVKLEMTEKELNMMVYMLGAIDLRTEPATLEVAMALRKKLDNAQKFVKKPLPRPTDKYGKPITADAVSEEIEKAREVAKRFTTPQAGEIVDTVMKSNPSAKAVA